MPPAQTARPRRAVLFPDNEKAAWLRLSLTRGIGLAGARTLLAAFGLPEDVFAADRSSLAQVIGAAAAARMLAPDPGRERAVEEALDWANRPGNRLLSLIDPDYPAPLLQTADPPILLYARGAPEVLHRPCLAIVGSRTPTAGGARTATAFARALADTGLAIASGLARGIDSAAHAGALGRAGGTVAVLGTGIDAVYPPENRALADAIADGGGAVLSEMPLGSGPRKSGFPRRNRVIAGMSLGVLVVEAALRSGSLITARLAAEADRDVFAIPGSIHSPLSRGCHLLIKQGARLVECAEDVLSELPPRAAPGAGPLPPSGAAAGAGARAPDPLLALMGWDPTGIDSLVALGAGEGPAVAARLLELELAGCVDRLADGRYQRRA
jgi:DNA processing protein